MQCKEKAKDARLVALTDRWKQHRQGNQHACHGIAVPKLTSVQQEDELECHSMYELGRCADCICICCMTIAPATDEFASKDGHLPATFYDVLAVQSLLKPMNAVHCSERSGMPQKLMLQS